MWVYVRYLTWYVGVENAHERAAVQFCDSKRLACVFTLLEVSPLTYTLSPVHSPDLVLGELDDEDGRAGLTSQQATGRLQLRRGRGVPWTECILVNRRGPLGGARGNSVYFGGDTQTSPAIVSFERLICAATDTCEALELVRSPDDPRLLTLPPVGVTAHDFEAQHFAPDYVTVNAPPAPPLPPQRDDPDPEHALSPPTSIRPLPEPPRNTDRERILECIRADARGDVHTMDTLLFILVCVCLVGGALVSEYALNPKQRERRREH